MTQVTQLSILFAVQTEDSPRVAQVSITKCSSDMNSYCFHGQCIYLVDMKENFCRWITTVRRCHSRKLTLSFLYMELLYVYGLLKCASSTLLKTLLLLWKLERRYSISICTDNLGCIIMRRTSDASPLTTMATLPLLDFSISHCFKNQFY